MVFFRGIRHGKANRSALFLAAVATRLYAAAASGLVCHGSMYSDLSLYHHGIVENDSLAFGGRTTLSLQVKNTNRTYGKIEADLDIVQLYGAQADAMYGMVPDPLIETASAKGAPMVLDLRTLSYSVYLPMADLCIGRQIVNFGKGFLFSPVDLFSSVDIVDLNFRRRGSDAAAARFPLGALAGIDVISEFPVAENEYSSAIKAFANYLDFDWSILGIYRNRANELIAGAACRGDAVVGLYGEAAAHYRDRADVTFAEAMFGADYSFFSGDCIITAEYLYSDEPDSMTGIWGTHNSFMNVTYRMNEIMSIGGNVILNHSEEMAVGTIQYFHNIRQNVDVIAYLRGFHGTLQGIPSPPDLEYAFRIEVKY